MSYTKRYRETVSKTVTVSYPEAKGGGVKSVTVDIPVEVNINVDTRPFDQSVENCGNNVNLLTAAVVATESAEIISKKENSIKIADAVIGGFYSYIRSEISQQIAELKQNIDAHLMHLKTLAQSCFAKKKQMEVDYNRITSRYVKIFEDLNNELSNRIHELDKPTFTFKKETDKQKIRTTDNTLVNIVVVGGKESGDLQSRIGASVAKKRALDALGKAKLFLLQQKQLNYIIQRSMFNECVSNLIYAPLCYVEKNIKTNQTVKTVYNTDFLSILNNEQQNTCLIDNFSIPSITWNYLSQDDQKNIDLYFNAELNNNTSPNDLHSERVRIMIHKLADFKSIQVINTINNKS